MNNYLKIGLIGILYTFSFNAAALLIIDDALDSYSPPGDDTGGFSTIAAPGNIISRTNF